MPDLIDKQNNPLVSVIIPTLNRPEMIEEAIKSVLNQTLPVAIEIVVVNDGGRDIQDIIDRLNESGNIVYVSHDKNKGISAARNSGLRLAKGLYIAYLDDDDLYYPNHLEKAISVLEEGKYRVVYTDCEQRFQTLVNDRYVNVGECIRTGHGFDRENLLIVNHIHTLTVVHHRDLLKENGFFDESLESHEDWDLWIRFSLKNDFYYIPEATAVFITRLDRTSQTSRRLSGFLKTLRIVHERYNHLVENPAIIKARKQVENELILRVDEEENAIASEALITAQQYNLIKYLSVGKRILHMGWEKSEGFPSLVDTAASIVDVEMDDGYIATSSVLYDQSNLQVVKCVDGRIPVADLFDIIVCTGLDSSDNRINTLPEDEIRRLMKPEGLFIVFIQNGKMPWQASSSFLFDDFDNGVDLKKIDAIFSRIFRYVRIYKQSLTAASCISPLSFNSAKHQYHIKEFDSGEDANVPGGKRSTDTICLIASNISLPSSLDCEFVCIDNRNSIHAVQNSFVNHLKGYTKDLLTRIHEKDFQINTLNMAFNDKDHHIKNLEQVIDNQNKKAIETKDYVENMENILTEKESYIACIQDEYIKKMTDAQIAYNKQLNDFQKEYDQFLYDKDVHINNIENETRLIRSSRVWRCFECIRKIVFYRILGRFPLLQKGVLSLSQEGFKIFFTRLKDYMRKKNSYFPVNGMTRDYDKWLGKNNLEKDRILGLKNEMALFEYTPKISIIMPVYNVDQEWLERAIQSVMGQIYENWELCIADDASPKQHIIKVLEEYKTKDSRIKVAYLDKNQGISGASNEALALAEGEFIALLDHDDELTKDALHACVRLLNEKSDVEFIYSDEDKIDEKGKRSEPFFKPDFSKDLLLSMNYICHFSMVKREIINRIGGFRKGYEGSQDYDLFLRLTDHIRPDRIGHVSEILYHWRKIPGSAAASVDAKGYAYIAAKKALNDYLERNGIKGEVWDGFFIGSYRVKRKIVEYEKVSIIIPFKDKKEYLEKCISSIKNKTDYRNYEIVLVNNQSIKKDTLAYLKTIKEDLQIKILDYDNPFNFSAINNFAVSQVNTPYILFLNNDIEVISGDWLSAMMEHAQRPEVGMVGAKLLYEDNTVQHAGVIMGLGVASHGFRHLPDSINGYCGLSNVIRNYSAVTAACMLMRRDVFLDLDGFNEEKLSVAYNDVDLCLRAAENGYLIVYTPYAKLYHYESVSRGDDNGEQLEEINPQKYERVMAERIYMEEKWKRYLENDPFYNINLTRNSGDFSIRNETYPI